MDTVEKINITIATPFIKLDQFLKWQNLVSSGTEAKFLITAGKVSVNEEIEYRRGRKLLPGDQVQYENRIYILSLTKI